MWPATVRAAQCSDAQLAGVGDVGALAKAWGLRFHSELQDTQTAVPRPNAGEQPATASQSGWGSTSTEFSR